MEVRLWVSGLSGAVYKLYCFILALQGVDFLLCRSVTRVKICAQSTACTTLTDVHSKELVTIMLHAHNSVKAAF